MENKQTTVDFLYEFVLRKLSHEQQTQFEGLFYQAKHMEKFQKELVWIDACDYAISVIRNKNNIESIDAFQKYYNQTYGK